MIKLFTIGFAGKSAEEFFSLLHNNGVKKIVDTRINNVSQLAGFTKSPDLKFFARKLANIDYEHNIELAPIRELLTAYRNKKISWVEYETKYLDLLDQRKIAQKLNIADLDMNCLLCSEHSPEFCHRRLLAEYLQNINKDIRIIHL